MIPAVTGAVSAKWSKGSGGPAGDEAYNLVTHTLRGDSFDASEDGTGRGTPIIAFNVAPAIQASGAGTERTGNERTEAGLMIPAGDAVRRLTPRECERLQGFPDGYTLVPTRRGKMRAHEMNEMARYLVISALEAWAVGATPDGPRYRALGNSMAVPVVRWLGRRMESLT